MWQEVKRNLVGPKVVFGKLQERQPDTDDERDLADHDLSFLLDHLAESRSESYELVARPDEEERQGRAPDYLVLERKSQRRIAIERTLLMEQELQAAKARLIKGGAAAIVIGARAVDPVAVAELLSRVIAEKIAHGQLGAVRADEKILLVRNRVMATARTFLQGPVRFPTTCRDEVDHAFLIAGRQLLMLW